MRQEVNLYADDFRPRREWLTLEQLAASAVAVIVLVALAALLLQLSLNSLRDEQRELEADVTEARTLVTELDSTLQQRREDVALADRVDRLEQQVRDRRRLLSRADEVTQATREGFTPYLRGVARNSFEGLWLTAIRVNLVRGHVGLEGRAQAGGMVPEYLQKLQTEDVFEGRRFAHFSIDRPDDDEVLGFAVSSRRPGETEGRP